MADDLVSPATGNDRMTNPAAFFAGFLRKPLEVGSVLPSSRFLERKIVAAAELAQTRCVVELGPGTGGTTRAILARLPSDAALLAIDTSPQFIRMLGELNDPRLIPHLGSAVELRSILAAHGLPQPAAVISGIPFSTMPPAVGRAIIDSVRTVLVDGGRFVAYQFRGDVGTLASPLLGTPDCLTEWRNVPPMRVYRWRKRAS